ncbi:MAG: sialidase family protein [Armatimonadetes bacterium]|nr:sialidase family protein [Armatimonadota bacterium]
MTLCLALCALSCTFGAASAQTPAPAPPVGHQIVCRDAGAGGYQAFPDVARLRNSDLLCVFYAGYGHIAHPTAALPRGARICSVRSRDNGKSWGAAEVVADTPWDDRDPHIALLANGDLLVNWFTYYPGGPSARPGDGTRYKEIWTTRSRDQGRTWSEPELIPSTASAHYGVSAPVRRLRGGALLMPIYKELPDPLRVWSYVLLSKDGGKTWGEPIVVDPGNDDNDEPDVIERPDGSLLCVMRSNRGEQTMWRSVSRDGGRTWSRSTPIGFPGHAPYLLRTRWSSVTLLAHRLPGTALHVSRDEGETWGPTVPVDSVIGAYPSLVELGGGRVLIVYYEEGPNSAIRARVFRVGKEGLQFEAAPGGR